jgi:hypothetical protein
MNSALLADCRVFRPPNPSCRTCWEFLLDSSPAKLLTLPDYSKVCFTRNLVLQ